jgi:hypothetical protein
MEYFCGSSFTSDEGETEGCGSRCVKEDVLDFSNLLCEIISMKTSTEANQISRHSRQGLRGIREFRSIASQVPMCLLEMIQKGLSENVASRPTMDEYCKCLRDVIDLLESHSKIRPKETIGRRGSSKRCFQRRQTILTLSTEDVDGYHQVSPDCDETAEETEFTPEDDKSYNHRQRKYTLWLDIRFSYIPFEMVCFLMCKQLLMQFTDFRRCRQSHPSLLSPILLHPARTFTSPQPRFDLSRRRFVSRRGKVGMRLFVLRY